MATPRFFLRVGSWYKSFTGKALTSDIEITDIVNNLDPNDPFIEDDGSGGGASVQTITAGTNITLGGTASNPIINASGGGGGGTLQDAIDAGAVLDKSNIIDGGGFNLRFHNNNVAEINAGDDGYVNSITTFGVAPPACTIYSQDDAVVNTNEFKITPTTVTINKNNAGAKGVATDLQSAITTGAVLTEDNVIEGGNYTTSIVAGTQDFSEETGSVSIAKTAGSIYVQGAGGVASSSVNVTGTNSSLSSSDADNSTVIRVTSTSAAIQKDGGALKEIATVDYLVYTALLSQSGTDAPVATVLQNTLGGNVVWSRLTQGNYRGTLSSAFTNGKTFTLISNYGVTMASNIQRVSDNEIDYYTLDDTWTAQDGEIVCVEIRVYP